MRRTSSSRTARIRLIGAACAALALFPAAAQAACPEQPTRQVFSRFGDDNWYYPAPGGTFESGSAAWTLWGGALVAGNETFFLNATSDRQSLRLPAGTAAISPWICVSREHPTMRMVARDLSGSGGTLRVQVVTSTGAKLAGSFTNTGPYRFWQPTPALDLAALTGVSASSDTTISVRLRISADGDGPWGVDDVFMDPYRR